MLIGPCPPGQGACTIDPRTSETGTDEEVSSYRDRHISSALTVLQYLHTSTLRMQKEVCTSYGQVSTQPESGLVRNGASASHHEWLIERYR
jgi:hypothetical protein